MSDGELRALLEKLEAAKTRRGGPSPSRRIQLLSRRAFPDAESLIRYHEALLFLRAYPPDRRTVRVADRELLRFARRVGALAKAGGDLAPFDDPEVSGIAGTAIETDYSFDVVRWLRRRHGRRVQTAWGEFEGTDRLRALWPRFLPLLEEEALEDANVPYRTWLAAAGGRDELAWLIGSIEMLTVGEVEKAERYDALGLKIRWELADPPASRSGLRWPARKVFLHDGPLIARREVSLEAELAGPPIPARRVSRREGERAVDLARESTVLRYREYYGFTYADSATVRKAEIGRGVEVFLFGLEQKRRLPLRAGFAAFIVKNGVPVGYVEALGFFERMEIGFNVYYAFREGETAWIFAKVANLLRASFGASSLSIDPYQIGDENPEAIDSGAYWFYRKLGFHPTSQELRRVSAREEERIRERPGYRSPPPILRRLARRNVIYDAPPVRAGDWDGFHIRNIGLAVQRRMAQEFGGDAERMRGSCLARVSRILGIAPQRWTSAAREALTNLSLVWNLIPDLARWPQEDKGALANVARAKAAADERAYLRRMQRHVRLRSAMLRLGTRRPS